jgi:outer membrane protein TolC
MKYLFFIFMTISAHAAITPLIVKESALKNHPLVLVSIERMRGADEAVNGAIGFYDTKIVSDYRRQIKGEYRNTVSRSFLMKPLPIANSKIYAGSEQISNPTGKFSPFYNTGNPSTTGQSGNYSVLGIQLSLWKNLFLDPSRAALKNAKYNALIAKADKRLTELTIARLGQLAYWEWVTAIKVKNAFEELLKNGETRNDYLISRSKKGDVAQILVTENEQYIASRKRALQAAKERLIRSEFALSLFYRDENGEPLVPAALENFEDYPKNLSEFLVNLDLNSSIDDLMPNRPDLKNLAIAVDKTEVDLELAKQDLRPQIDLTSEYFQRTAENPNMPRDYLMMMAQVSIPLERNLGKGNIEAARARQMVTKREMNYGKEKYKVEVMSLRESLRLRLEQALQAEIEFSKSKELVETETYKFKSGGGSLFLINLREEAQASAEASFHDARLSFMDTFLSYEALVSGE